MSLTSLYTGISGLQSYSNAMSVIGNNLANVNTTGFKASRISFEDIFSQSITSGAGSVQVGRGVQVGSVHRIFSQSSFQTTSTNTDLAIDGDGFFVVAKDAQQYYTRAGEFILDNNGILVNHRGYALQGLQIDENGNYVSGLQDIDLSSVNVAPRATTSLSLNVNLDADAQQDPGGPAFDVNDAFNTSNYYTSMTVYDPLGNSHLTTFYFRRTDVDSWSWHAVVDESELDDGTGNPVGAGPHLAADGTLDFTDGRLSGQSTTTAFNEQFLGSSGPQAITVDFGDLYDPVAGTGGLETTQFAGGASTEFISQDGYAQGDLISILINNEGVVSGLFSNGQTLDVYQLRLARFMSPWGLNSIGRNLFAETTDSGPPLEGFAGTSGLGQINSNSLELSNVDLATEFVEMIRTQQAFQANSRVITTTDQMLQELVNLKR
jgi:flagellar hook protein FlgE